MKDYIKRKIAKTVDSRKYDWLWDKISDTYFGYYLRKLLLFLMNINEDAAIRDIVAEEGGIIMKMTHPDSHKERFNVLIIQLPLPSNRKHKRILPMGIAYMAAYLRKKNPDINVGILDAQCQNLSYNEILDKVKEINWNLVGISYWTVQKKFAQNLTIAIKNFRNDIKVVHGGVHTTVIPEDALKSADYAVLHEGEETLANLAKTLRDGEDVKNVKGIAYLENEKIIKNEIRPVVNNIDELPRPAYDLLPIEKYKMPLHVTGGDRLPIMGSRGCPYSCSFCTSPILWQKKVRWRNARNVVDEIEWLIKTYEINKLHFWDDNFTLNQRYVREFCNEIKSRNLKIDWIALDRAEHINKAKDLLPLMKESGCIGIEIGLESANPDTFSHISKDQELGESKNAIKNLKDANIIPLYTCMVFNPGESIVGYYMQKEFLDDAQKGYSWHKFFHPFAYPVYIGQFATPYPKTAFNENLEKQSLILCEEEEDRFHHQINSIPFSLLNDVPLRTIDVLDEELYAIFLNAVKLAFWTTFPANDSKYMLSEKLYDVWRFIYPFFHKSDGRLTVNQIALRLSYDLNFHLNKALRLTAFATYIYGQLGVIRSAIHHTTFKMIRKNVKIPLAVKLDLFSLLKRKGITRGKLIPVKGKM